MELVSGCVECGLAEPESLASLGGSAPGVVDGILLPFGVAVLYTLVQKFTICSLKSKENIIFAHNFILKQNTNQASHCFEFHLCIFFLVKGLDTSNQLQSILTLIV